MSMVELGGIVGAILGFCGGVMVTVGLVAIFF